MEFQEPCTCGHNTPSTADDSGIFESTIDEVDELCSNIAPSFCTYLRNKLAPVLLQHVVSSKNNHNITTNWSNNNAESANHILKHAVDWKPQHLPALIETLKKTVQLQYTDLNRALTSRAWGSSGSAFIWNTSAMLYPQMYGPRKRKAKDR